MKRIFPFLLLLTLCAGCAKLNYQYAVVCDFPAFYRGQSWLVVSNNAGSILKIFDLPAGSSHFSGEFDYEVKDAAETYNLHLAYRGDTLYPLSMVFSYYGVQNGVPVSFLPAALYPSPGHTHRHLFISGMEAFHVANIPGGGVNGWRYNATTQTTQLLFDHLDQSDFIVRVRATPAAPFHALYVPAALISDSIFVQWKDFSPDHHSVTVEPPGDESVHDLEVAAVEPDFKRFVMLVEADSLALSTSVDQQIPLPTGLHPQSLFRVRMRQGDFTAEKMFLPGATLGLEAPRISIKSTLFSPFRTLQVASGGSPDLIEVQGYTYKVPPHTLFVPPPSFEWRVQGPPASFVKMRLPDLTELLPALRSLGTGPISWRVTAYQYDHLDYDQLLAGFPYKGSDGRVFPIARSGLQMVTKEY